MLTPTLSRIIEAAETIGWRTETSRSDAGSIFVAVFTDDVAEPSIEYVWRREGGTLDVHEWVAELDEFKPVSVSDIYRILLTHPESPAYSAI